MHVTDTDDGGIRALCHRSSASVPAPPDADDVAAVIAHFGDIPARRLVGKLASPVLSTHDRGLQRRAHPGYVAEIVVDALGDVATRGRFAAVMGSPQLARLPEPARRYVVVTSWVGEMRGRLGKFAEDWETMATLVEEDATAVSPGRVDPWQWVRQHGTELPERLTADDIGVIAHAFVHPPEADVAAIAAIADTCPHVVAEGGSDDRPWTRAVVQHGHRELIRCGLR